MSWWFQRWHLQSAFFDVLVTNRLGPEDAEQWVGPGGGERLSPEEAALQVEAWADDPDGRVTFGRIAEALWGPGMLPAHRVMDLPDLVDQLREAFLRRELVAVRVARPTGCHREPKGPGPVVEASWIRIRVVHGQVSGRPVVGRPYRLTLPGGRVISGRTGRSPIEKRDIDGGACDIAFPWQAPAVIPGPGGQPKQPGSQAWRAAWDRPTAKDGDVRTMTLDAPTLADGALVRFVVSRVTERPASFEEVGQVEATVAGGRASVTWSRWHTPDAPPFRVEAGRDAAYAAFPTVRFTFVAEADGRQLACQAPCAYADTLWIRLVSRFGDAEADPLDRCAFCLVSPWGTYRGITDDDGCFEVRGLPPGGAQVMVGDRLVVHEEG